MGDVILGDRVVGRQNAVLLIFLDISTVGVYKEKKQTNFISFCFHCHWKIVVCLICSVFLLFFISVDYVLTASFTNES